VTSALNRKRRRKTVEMHREVFVGVLSKLNEINQLNLLGKVDQDVVVMADPYNKAQYQKNKKQ
jgi:adenine-specific DNA methylase